MFHGKISPSVSERDCGRFDASVGRLQVHCKNTFLPACRRRVYVNHETICDNAKPTTRAAERARRNQMSPRRRRHTPSLTLVTSSGAACAADTAGYERYSPRASDWRALMVRAQVGDPDSY